MRKEQVYPAGFKVYDDNNNLIGYGGEHNGDGYIYKNEDAFANNPDEVCYIPEAGFGYDTYKEFISLDEAEKLGETRNTITEQISNGYKEDYMLTDEQVDCCTKSVFHDLDWSCVSSYITESSWIEDLIEFSFDMLNKRVFTQFQYEAIMNNQTPKEYADRQLSYGELIELDREFDDAFIVDEDCVDDWSDKGLGANARLTYIEERRTGLISGPDEFDCDDKWRKYTKR